MSNPATTPSSLANDPFLRDVPEVDGLKTLDPAVLHSKLGQGGMGAVYRGRHRVLGIDVAVKCLLPSHGAQDDQLQARFRREARIAAQLSHENLVRLYELRHAHGLSYLILELVEGETAQARVLRKGPLSEEEAATIVLCASRGLAKAHRHREVIVHRDIKPANILISKRGEVKLADLGLAKAVDHVGDSSFHTDGLLGTPPYMAPEQWDADAKASPQTDVWAMGATLYYLLTGRVALKGATTHQIFDQAVNRPFPDPRVVRPDLSPELARIVRRCTQKEPAKRYADASALAKELQNFLRARVPLPTAGGSDGPQTTVPDVLPPSDLAVQPAPVVSEAVALVPEAAPATRTSGLERPEPVREPTVPGSSKRLLAAGAAVVGAVTLGVVTWTNLEAKAPAGWTILDATRGTGGWARRVREPKSEIEFLLVEPGEFTMGSPAKEPHRDAAREAAHHVQIPEPFYLARTEVTRLQFWRLFGDEANRPGPESAELPRTSVSWDQASDYCKAIGCVLPTEARWEFAARSGTDSSYVWGGAATDGRRRGNFADASWAEQNSIASAESAFPFDDGHAGLAPVGEFEPNRWGFHDMSGNVAEWCEDAFVPAHELMGERDPIGRGDPKYHSVRGGSFKMGPKDIRVASRKGNAASAPADEIGFRPMRRLP